MAKTNTTITVVAICAVLLLGLMSYAIFFRAPQTALGGQANIEKGGIGYISTGSTGLTVIGTDTLNPGTAVSGTTSISTDGSAFVTDDFSPSASPNQILQVLVINNSAYHNVYVKDFKVPTSPTAPINAPMYGNATVTMTIFNTDGVKVTGNTINQTVAAGGAYNMKLRMDGQDKKSTNDMRCVIESSDKTKSDTLTLSGFGATLVGTSVPSSYSSAAGSQVVVYDLAPIIGAVSPEGTLAISSKSGQSLTGKNLKITCFTKESFLDSATGKVAYDIEDSLGNSKSIASYTATVYFT